MTSFTSWSSSFCWIWMWTVKVIFFENLIWVWSPLVLIARKAAALFFYGSCFISLRNADFPTWRLGNFVKLWKVNIYCFGKFVKLWTIRFEFVYHGQQKGCDFQRKRTHGRLTFLLVVSRSIFYVSYFYFYFFDGAYYAVITYIFLSIIFIQICNIY